MMTIQRAGIGRRRRQKLGWLNNSTDLICEKSGSEMYQRFASSTGADSFSSLITSSYLSWTIWICYPLSFSSSNFVFSCSSCACFFISICILTPKHNITEVNTRRIVIITVLRVLTLRLGEVTFFIIYLGILDSTNLAKDSRVCFEKAKNFLESYEVVL